MTRLRPAANVFTIPAGRPFLPELVAALLEDRLDIALSAAGGPLALADATIYVPTRRAAAALTAAFGEAIAGPLLLPRIVPLGGLGEIEDGLVAEGHAFDDAGLPPAIDDLERRLHLTRLTAAWSRHVRMALVAAGRAFDEPAEPIAVAASMADAFGLAGDLAALLDDLILSRVPWSAVARLAPDHDPYWALTTDFLTIVSEAWPGHLAGLGLLDASERQNRLLAAEAERLRRQPPQAPLIVAGSTGSVPATAELMQAIARLPRGVVVLPGLDQDIDETAWNAVGVSAHRPDAARAGHPQAALKRLIGSLGVTRAQVRPLAAPEPALAARMRLVSEAMRPAETTHLWRGARAGFSADAMHDALAGVTLVEAADEHHEALAIALVLREALETPGQTAALVTPDRLLAHRVTQELARWRVEIDDSAGLDLAGSAAGTFARLAAATIGEDFAAPPLLALLDNPGVALDRSRPALEPLASALEIACLRGQRLRSGLAGLRQAAATATTRPSEPHAPQPLRRLDPAVLAALPALVETIGAAFRPLCEVFDGDGDVGWCEAFSAFAASLLALARREDESSTLDDMTGGAELLERLDAIAAADAGLRLRRHEFPGLLDALMQGVPVRRAEAGHPRLRILGLLEARLLPVDLCVLGGLNEGVWPPAARTDAFLNRPMRMALGLDPPERRIGQTAHDFCQAMGHARVVLTRAARIEGAPSVASRFLRRLAAFSGPAFEEVVARGRPVLQWAAALDRPAGPARPAPRPAPRPPLALRPARISVTAVETLYRDPYALYARDILRLDPLDPISPGVDAADRGNLIHDALAAYVAGDIPADAAEALERLVACGREAFAPVLDEPEVAAFWWPRFLRIAQWFVADDADRRPGIAESLTETSGGLDLVLADGSPVRLGARADRIDLLADGSIAILDYKTGTPPGDREILVGLAPQLTLQAAIAMRGGFKAVPAGRTVAEIAYVRLSGADNKRRSVAFKDHPLAEVARQHLEDLVSELSRYRDPATGYLSRRRPRKRLSGSAYDHLARVREWSEGGAEDETGESE